MDELNAFTGPVGYSLRTSAPSELSKTVCILTCIGGPNSPDYYTDPGIRNA